MTKSEFFPTHFNIPRVVQIPDWDFFSDCRNKKNPIPPKIPKKGEKNSGRQITETAQIFKLKVGWLTCDGYDHGC